jgi:hypothetical protein
MSAQVPPIVKLAESLLVQIEQAVCAFPRRHKFTVGTELRKQAMDVALLASRSWRDRANQRTLVRQLVWDIDALKQRLQLGCLLKAFASFKQFEALARLVQDLGRQVGGWFRSLHPSAQKSTPSAASTRGQTLSTRAASIGAQP